MHAAVHPEHKAENGERRERGHHCDAELFKAEEQKEGGKVQCGLASDDTVE